MSNVPALDLVVVGAGGHAVSVAEVARSAGHRVLAFVDPRRAGASLLGLPVVERPDALLAAGAGVVVAIGDNAARQREAESLRARFAGIAFPVLVHASASVSGYALLGEGSVVMQHATVGSNARVGAFCIVNTAASIDHDAVMADGASIAPGAVTGGRVSIGPRAAVSIGAVVKHGVAIGADSVLGAHSYLHRDLPERCVAYGSPARVVRSRQPGEPYLD
jgi:sugar O-acyltransferase (sialic acid O-acetyltransferase NeuD family)